jgi:DNA-binding phage protein
VWTVHRVSPLVRCAEPGGRIIRPGVLTNNQRSATIEPMSKKQAKLTDQLREAIATCGKSMGQIARESGIDIATISRFMHGKGGLSMDGLDRIAECLGVGLTTPAQPRSQKGG